MDPHALTVMILKDLNPPFPLPLGLLAEYLTEKGYVDRPIEFHVMPLPVQATALCYCRPEFLKIRIILNSNRPDGSQRFGGFHELGHLALGHKIGLLRLWGERINGEEDPLERVQADQFATEIMMPESHVFQLAAHYDHPFVFIEKMREVFRASLEAVVRRLVELRIFHGAFFLYNPRKLYFAYSTPDFFYDLEKMKKFLIQEYKTIYEGQEFVWFERELEDGTMEYYTKYLSGNVLLALVKEKGNLYSRLATSWSEWFGKDIPAVSYGPVEAVLDW
jgi:hypothetical protein